MNNYDADHMPSSAASDLELQRLPCYHIDKPSRFISNSLAIKCYIHVRAKMQTTDVRLKHSVFIAYVSFKSCMHIYAL